MPDYIALLAQGELAVRDWPAFSVTPLRLKQTQPWFVSDSWLFP